MRNYRWGKIKREKKKKEKIALKTDIYPCKADSEF